jgi:hypothetical protein
VSHRFIDAADNHIVSLDGTYLYYTTIGVEMEPQVKRFRFADHQIETITSEGDLRLRGISALRPMAPGFIARHRHAGNLTRSMSAGPNDRKPTASVTGVQLKLLQLVSCRRIS